ncbi:MAG: transglycosylase SLT domain-containing protein [Candidatus Dadabacteria bacterium]|nr:transglycosylase SLT domain-containing protein [Candidatus Dadabacteria bacterium]NIS08961.1 transglycosylase SLT domain-containing protein [Candidatus Dadabacteria bacterium]NIV40776.1 transglycosylase SLT domain-containing protein [Candidatus Dadabacteria bacterium]NIY22268.1 transglycosylase SLT domain-containing protein [Candidatus Dadabacteria bacterium]
MLKKRVSESLAEIHFQQKDYAKAEKLYRELYNTEKNDKKKPEYLFGVANSLKGQKKFQEAINTYKNIWVEHPTSKYSKLSNGQALSIAKENNLSFKISPNDYYSRAQKFFIASLWNSALKNYKKSPQTTAVKVNTAICYLRIGHYTRALAILDKINSSKSLFWQAQIRAKQDMNDLAAKIHLQLVKNYPKSHIAPQALFNAAKLYEIDKRLDDATAAYEQLIAKYPKTEYAEDASWNLGWIYYKKNEYQKAYNTFSGFINSGSSFNSTRSEYWSARTLEKLGNEKQANYIYKRLSRRFFPSYYPYLAQIKTGFDDKSKIRNDALEPNNSNSKRKAKAMLLIELGILEDALLEVRHLHKAAKSVSDFIDLSILYGKANDFYNAIQVVQGINHPDALRLSYPQGYSEIVHKYSKLYGVDEYIIYSIMREESRYQKDVVSPAKAIGLMQLIPDTGRKTAKELGIKDYSKKKLYDPETNIRLGSYYFKKVLDEFGGNVFFALGGYNAGPHRIYQWKKRFPGLNMDEFVEEVPFRETRNYIRRVLRSYGAYKALYDQDRSM